MQNQRKPYTIELSRDDAAPVVAEVVADASTSATLAVVLKRIEELAAAMSPGQALIANISAAYRREVQEVLKLREEMAEVQQAIVETKRQVVAFHASTGQTVTVNHAAGELGAVVLDTEGATNNILAAAEHIEMLAGVIQSEKTTAAMKERAGEIAAHVMSIYEACNFQDLTGQRIARVCDTLTFVENRIARMAEIWGGLDSLSALMEQELQAQQERQHALGTHALAAGPVMVGAEADSHVAQDEIDALFD